MAAGETTFTAPLSQGFGYGIIIGLGFAFALLMIFITWALKRSVYFSILLTIHSSFLEQILKFLSTTATRMKCKPPKCSQQLDVPSNPALLLLLSLVVGLGRRLCCSRQPLRINMEYRVPSSMLQVSEHSSFGCC